MVVISIDNLNLGRMCKHLTDFSDVTPNLHLLIRASALIANLFFLILVTVVIANLAFLIHYERETKRSVEKKMRRNNTGDDLLWSALETKNILDHICWLTARQIMCNKNMNIKDIYSTKKCHT
jgi:hypothetical protein